MEEEKMEDKYFEYEEVYGKDLREYKKEFNSSKIDEILEQFEVAKINKDQELFNKCEDSFFLIRDTYAYLFENFEDEDLI